MVIVIGSLGEGTGQQRVVALPGTGSIGCQDGGPTRVITLEYDWLGGQEKIIGKRWHVQNEFIFGRDGLWNAALVGRAPFIH